MRDLVWDIVKGATRVKENWSGLNVVLLISDKHTIQTTLGVQSSPSILLCMVLSHKASCVQEYVWGFQ
jgi:hypothetical protein